MKKISLMKKILLTLLLIASGAELAAQTGRNPNPLRDTIIGRDPTYHYCPFWYDMHDDSVAPGAYDAFSMPWDNCYPGKGLASYWSILPKMEYAELHITDTPLSIIGLAACPYIQIYNYSTWPGAFWDTVWQHATNELRLYNHIGDSMYILASETIDLVDTDRWMEYGWEYFYDDNNRRHTALGYHPVVERYFEKPITVQDSFYVGVLFHTAADVNQLGLINHYPITYLAGANPYNVLHAEGRTYEGMHVAYRGFENTILPDWVFERAWILGPAAIFAIFDTTGMGLTPQCDTVTNLHQGSVWDYNTILLWDSTDGQVGWQLAVGRADQDTDSYRIYNLTSPSKALYNLNLNTVYAARIRAKCKGSRNYSQWSDTIHFSISEPQRIATLADRHTHLLPNPAADKVTVVSSFSLQHVEVYDLSGRKMLNRDCQGISTVLDIADWPVGNYIVLVRTPAGATTQKLTVSR